MVGSAVVDIYSSMDTLETGTTCGHNKFNGRNRQVGRLLSPLHETGDTFFNLLIRESYSTPLACRIGLHGSRSYQTTSPVSPSRVLNPLAISTIDGSHAVPYLAYTRGIVPIASRIIIGVLGLCFFIVGYARCRNDLKTCQSYFHRISCWADTPRRGALFGRVAEEEAEFLQAGGEGVFGGHGDVQRLDMRPPTANGCQWIKGECI